MLDKDLIYSGPAWPLAEVIDSGKKPAPRVIDRFSGEIGVENPPPQPSLWFKISAAGRPRPWNTSQPLGFWRSFAELTPWADPDYGERAAALVRRYGPFAESTSHELVTDTHTWVETRYLAKVANAWEPEGRDGVSRLSANRTLRDDAVSMLVRSILPITMPKVEVAFDYDLRPQLHARSLYAFMALSAASALRRAALMRRCQHCQVWFEPPRVDALYCSGACRSAHFHTRASASARPRKKARRHG